MEESKEKIVVFSSQYAIDSEEVFDYGLITFGEFQAIKYESFIDKLTSELSTNYLMYPECRWLSSKSRKYRNIILDSHLIIYRIQEHRIEVLRLIHAQSSIKAIKRIRKISL